MIKVSSSYQQDLTEWSSQAESTLRAMIDEKDMAKVDAYLNALKNNHVQLDQGMDYKVED